MPILVQDAAAAIRWAADHRARVIFTEFGEIVGWADPIGYTDLMYQLFTYPPSVLAEAVRYAWEHGALVLSAAGNLGFPGCSSPWNGIGVVCVGAVDDGIVPGPDYRGQKALYSNWGADVQLTAPGGGLAPTWLRSQPDRHDLYARESGTSGAVAYAAGIAALLMSAGANNEEALRVMECTADDLGPPGPDFVFGYGRINAARAMAALGSGITCPAPPRNVLDMISRGP
jgi:subtilisin family serine protease